MASLNGISMNTNLIFNKTHWHLQEHFKNTFLIPKLQPGPGRNLFWGHYFLQELGPRVAVGASRQHPGAEREREFVDCRNQNIQADTCRSACPSVDLGCGGVPVTDSCILFHSVKYIGIPTALRTRDESSLLGLTFQERETDNERGDE